MPFLCEKHRTQIQHRRIDADSLWSDLMQMGARAHQEKRFEDALRLFGSAAEVASLTLELDEQPNQTSGTARESPVERLVAANHNLSASLCAQQQTLAAEQVLTQLHSQVMALCLSNNVQRPLRIDALACLETTLFSLSAHLGHQGKVDTLHSIIEETERVAEQAAQTLFH